MAVVIYKCDSSAPSRAVLMALDILDLKIETRDVNPVFGENLKPEYLKKNHLHTVPVLEDGDFILADSHVIMTYLVSKFKPNCGLYPEDLKTKSTIDQRLYLESTLLTPKIITSVERLKKHPCLTEDQKADMAKVYGFLDKYLEGSKYLARNDVTLADVSCVSSLASLNLFVPIDGFCHLKDWFDRLNKEEWYQKVNAPGVAKFEEYLRQLKKNV